jgi:hypothetical protein
MSNDVLRILIWTSFSFHLGSGSPLDPTLKKKYTSSFSASIISKAPSELTERKAEVVLENQVYRPMFC